ncbi:MAG TPA: hypothetical protein VMT54_00205 [Candidatus Cybelea sp.]|nr:hypothetical protein [Candidatus Cybelea sp.]
MNIAARLAVSALVAVTLCSAAAIARADKLTEQNMTQKDYKDITNTETSIPGQTRAEPPLEIHDLSDANAQGVKDAHGVKVVKGKDWKALSPKDRDKRMRDLMKALKPGTFFFIEVPSGNVWAIDSDAYFKLKEDKIIHRWSYEEMEKLPKAVRGDASNRPEIRRSEGERFDVFSQF